MDKTGEDSQRVRSKNKSKNLTAVSVPTNYFVNLVLFTLAFGHTMKSTSSRGNILQRFGLLRELGPNLGRKKGTLWMRVNDTKGSRSNFPDTPTIEELIGVTNEDMVTAFGVKWRSSTFDSTNPGSELSAGFKYDKKNRGWFVSVLSGVKKVDKNAAPHKDFVVTRADVDSIKAQVKVRYKMSNTLSRKSTFACKAASKSPTTSGFTQK